MKLPAPPSYLGEVLKTECRLAEMALSHHFAGDLLLPTGRLVACDPVAYAETEAFSILLPVGRFPVLLSVARMSDDQRVAFATIRFADGVPARWEALGRQGSAGEQDSYGFGVDSGVAGFMDHSTVAAMRSKEQDDQQAFYEAMDAAMKETEVPTWSWLNVPFGNGNLIAFSPGYGDGEYLTYAGLRSDGAVAVMVTDFSIVSRDENAG